MTDGYLDNVFDEETVEVIKSRGTLNSYELSKNLAEFALRKSLNSQAKTPWGVETSSLSQKPDDITVVVAYYKKKSLAKL